jgi:hypothetical protein
MTTRKSDTELLAEQERAALQANRAAAATTKLERWRAVLAEEVAENMAIYSGDPDGDAFIPQAKALIRTFEAIEGQLPHDYLEIEKWSADHLDKGGRLLVVK